MEKERQKLFLEQYCFDLKRSLRKEDYSAFGDDRYEYDLSKVQQSNLLKPEGLLDKMMATSKDDLFSAAKELYVAYQDLSSLQAMYDPFWIYLSLVDLYPYVRRQYPDVSNYKNQYALNHYMMCKYTLYNLRGLWWAMKMTVTKNDDESDYTLSKFLLNGPSQLQLSLTESQLFRCENVVRGVLSYFINHENQCSREILNETMKHLNMLGSFKQLACLPPSFFEKEIEKMIPFIVSSQKNAQEGKKSFFKIVTEKLVGK